MSQKAPSTTATKAIANNYPSSIRNPEPSPFLRLPGELRNLIYSYVFCDLKLVVHGSKCYKVIPCANNSPATKAAFRLPEVCRLFYFETYLLLPQTATIIYRVNYGTMRKNYVMEGKEATVLPRRQVSAITSVVPNPPTVSIDMSRLFPGLKQIVMSKEMYAENGLIWWNVSHYGMMSGQWARQVHCSWHEKECIMNMLGDAATEDIEVKDCYRTLGKRPTKGESVYERLCKGKDGRGMASKSDCTFTI